MIVNNFLPKIRSHHHLSLITLLFTVFTLIVISFFTDFHGIITGLSSFHAFSQKHFSSISLTAQAQTETQPSSGLFQTNLTTTVTVNENGLSRIKQDFEIVNLTPTSYISQYGLKISSNQLKNIVVTSDGQLIEPEINYLNPSTTSGPGQTSIGITFDDKVVGEGKSRQFSISYLHPDAAIISGSVLEVSLPPQANPADYQQYTVHLVTPARFGPPVRTTPDQHSYTTQDDQVVTTFEQNGTAGIFALYGSEQIFDLMINYHLDNDTNNPGISQIALVPDTAYQRVYYHQLDPLPDQMELDPDGNWIATYHLPAGSKTTVKLQAAVKLSLEPAANLPIAEPNSTHLAALPYWPVDQAEIKELAGQHQTAAAINDYVVKTLSYNTQRALNNPERMGAAAALNQPDQAVCQEFTDLFITLARAANIPARRMTGYAYTQNSDLRPLSLVEDVLHAWPEYYHQDLKQWVPIDPTWENTTGGIDYFSQVDLSHIVFAINGQHSETPYPAGSYKADAAEKTVEVNFGSSFPELNASALTTSQELVPRKILGLNIPGLYTLKITNLSGEAGYYLPIEVSAQQVQVVKTRTSGNIKALLPFQTLEIPLQLQASSGFLPEKDTITISINHDSQTYQVTSGPRLSDSIPQPYLFIGVAAILVVSTLIAGSVLVFRKRPGSVRRKS